MILGYENMINWRQSPLSQCVLYPFHVAVLILLVDDIHTRTPHDFEENEKGIEQKKEELEVSCSNFTKSHILVITN